MNETFSTLRVLKITLKGTLLVAGLFLAFRAFTLSLSLLSPFIVAALVAILNDRAVRFMVDRLKLRRSSAALIMVAISASIFGLVVAAVSARIAAELTDLVARLPHFQEVLLARGAGFAATIRAYLYLVPPDVLAGLNDTASAILSKATDLFPGIVMAAFGLAALLPQVLFFVIVVVVASFFISRDLPSLTERTRSLFPRVAVEPGLKIFARLMSALFGWARTQLVIMSVNGVIVMIGLSIIGVRYVVLMGVIVGILDALPVLGPGTILLPWAAWGFLSGHLSLGVGLLIIFGLTVVARNSLEPLVLSENIGLEPLPTLISMYIGLRIVGFLGIALGPIVLVTYTALEEAGVIGHVKKWLLR